MMTEDECSKARAEIDSDLAKARAAIDRLENTGYVTLRSYEYDGDPIEHTIADGGHTIEILPASATEMGDGSLMSLGVTDDNAWAHIYLTRQSVERLRAICDLYLAGDFESPAEETDR
jgi:hypothetical protein